MYSASAAPDLQHHEYAVPSAPTTLELDLFLEMRIPTSEGFIKENRSFMMGFSKRVTGITIGMLNPASGAVLSHNWATGFGQAP